ncbi:putative uncharacterized protein CXorf58 homolog isoform X1 [Pygocentrus nattereri]|uniref:putative uncharacterized protein CXorf58 homolog isoform X1 n=1 Tax=Pygocentrus nattereri TaxID=42514 RepID=UPI000814714D|nr:putative uncharacterized protein CXorf58 homolog isoform X1 [Pygocentrus nattereri]
MGHGSDCEKREKSARRIQAFWKSYQDRKLFHLLMNTVRSAEQCVSPAVLRQVSPLEASLLTDRSLQCKVRFRFSGPQFPPVIVFKIFYTGRGRRYLSGKKLFRPSNQATADSYKVMGNRRFMELLMEDEVQWHGREISDPIDITCMRDYVQYSSHLDELPACMGGRENGWRCLSLQVLTRDRDTGPMVDKLKKEVLSRPSRPLRSPAAPPSSAVSSRRSARAQGISARRKLLYTRSEEQRALGEEQEEKQTHGAINININEMNEEADEELINPDPSSLLELDEDSQWEEEAEKLCFWTSQLTLDTIDQLDYI